MTNYHGSLSQDKVRKIIEKKEKRSLDPMEYFNQAWSMVQKDSNYVGFSAIVIIISGILGAVPYIGNVLSSISNAILYPGISIFTHQKLSARNPDFNTFFEGTKFAGPLLIQALLGGLILIALIAPALIPVFIYYDFNSGTMGEPSIPAIVCMVLFSLIGSILLFYLTISWIFAHQLIIFAGMGAWEAMEASRKAVAPNFWSIFFLMFLGGIAALIGILLCCVGLFWAMPTIQNANYLAFEDLFRLREDIGDETDQILEHLI